MKNRIPILIVSLFCFSFYNSVQNKTSDPIIKIEMNLSAFGVEADDFPSIAAFIDFTIDSSYCEKSFYNPAYKGSVYKLTKTEIKNMLKLLQSSDLKKLKPEYAVSKTDQPSSKITIYSAKEKIVVNDYGLEGESPLKELYKIAYRL